MEPFVFINDKGEKFSFNKEEVLDILRNTKGIVDTYLEAVITGKMPFNTLKYNGVWLRRILPDSIPEHLGKDKDGYDIWNSEAFKVRLI